MAYKMKGSPMQRNFGIAPMKQGDKLEKFTRLKLKPTATDTMAVHMYENVYKDDFSKKHGNWSDIYHKVVEKFPDLKGNVKEAPKGAYNAAEARKKYKLGIYK